MRVVPSEVRVDMRTTMIYTHTVMERTTKKGEKGPLDF